MFRRIFPTSARALPTIGKVSALTFAMLLLHRNRLIEALPFARPDARCFHVSFVPSNTIGQVLSRVIRVELNGEFVAYAYCFSEKLLVSASLGHLDTKNLTKDYEFFLGDEKLDTKFKVIGSFENLMFIEAKDNIIPVLPAHFSAPIITPVHIVQKRTYLSIKSGYYVTDDAGYGIIDGKGEVNSLVIDDKGVVGVVAQIGRDSDRGFLRMMRWKDIYHLARKLQANGEVTQPYMGLSVKASEDNDGLYVVRVASDSPLSEHVKMGDCIMQVNMNTVRSPQDLARVMMEVKKKVSIELKDSQGKTKNIQIKI